MFNTSSFLWRRAPVHAAIGYWDTVRFGADNEFIRRMQIVFGKGSFRKIPTGPLSFQREAASSVTGDPVKGLDSGGHYYGVRREYYNAQVHHHKTAANLKYGKDPNKRPFPVPPMMLLPGSIGYQRRFDVVICEDIRAGNAAVAPLCAEVETFAAQGKRVGLVELHRYETDLEPAAPEIRDLLARGLAEIVVYGDVVEAKDIHYRHTVPAEAASRFMPMLVHLT